MPIEYLVEGPVATIWLNRPDVRNAYDLPMLRRLQAAMAGADSDPAVRAIVIRGRGDSFCTGADISMLDSGQSWLELSTYCGEIFNRIAESRKVTVAVLHGYAVAGGFELMLACDFAVAAEEARIGDFHIRNGLYAGAGTIHRLPRIIGIRKTKELMLSGDALSGREAKEWNLVNAVAPLAELDGLVDRFVAKFTDKSPTVSWLTKMAVSRGLDGDAETLTILERMTSGVVAESADAREGVAAFLGKRRAAWQPLGPPLGAPSSDDDREL